jgi:ATP-binding cassette, subfamily B, bacterial
VRRRVPFVRQLAFTDCGAACLAMVLAYHGKQVPLDQVRQMTSTNRDGVDALAVTQAAQRYGLSARGLAADVDDLRYLPPATILHWDFTHFVVFERLRRNSVQIVDPAVGRRRLSMEVFRRSYTGVAIAFEPGEDFQTSKLHAKGTWRYLRPLLGQSRSLTRVLVGSVLLRLLALALPLLTGLLVDVIVPRDDRHLLLVTGATMAAIVGYFFLVTLLRSHLLLQLRTRLDVRLTTAFVEHLVDLPYSFFLGRSAGDLAMRLDSHTIVREFLTTGALSALIDGSLASLYLVLLFMLSPPLAALVLGMGLLQVMALMLSRRRNQHLMSESLQVEARAQGYTFELLAGIETLKASGAERRAAEHWERLFIDQVDVALRRGRLEASVGAVTGTLQLGAPLAFLVVGGLQVLNDSLSLGTMLAGAALAAGFLEPLATLIDSGVKLQLLRSYMERINEVLDAPREQEGQNVATAHRLSGRVRAEGVSFAYGPLAPPVVKDVSLEVEPGHQLGIVGRTGSGKSTLARLLLGMYPPTSGRILFDDTELAELELRSLRTQIGIVTQSPYLFGATIRQNIALNDPAMSHEMVVAAAKLACVHDEIVAMPMGYETRLVDRGASLSGGQQQRIALARALAHRPAILLLDEATSDLDGVTERSVHRNLSELGCTRIVIAHRLSTITDADLILVMEDGRIVQQGTHDELIFRPGPYRQQVAAQHGSDGREGRHADGAPAPRRRGRAMAWDSPPSDPALTPAPPSAQPRAGSAAKRPVPAASKPGPAAPRPKRNASSKRSSPARPTPPSAAPAETAPQPLTNGSGPASTR